MLQCPRCGSAVSSGSPQCPACGLRRPDAPSGGSQQPFRPPLNAEPPRRPATATLVTGLVVVVLALAVVATLWATGTAPFGSDGQPRAGTPPSLASPSVATRTVVVSPSLPTQTQTLTSSSVPTTAQSAPKDFAQVYAAVESGVGLISVDTCDAAYTGTGFLVGDDTVVTAAHVVEGASDVQVDFDGARVDAAITGVDPALDLAVLSIPPSSADRHVFELAAQDPDTGTHIAVIGYPLDEPKSLTEGTVSGLDRVITTESGTYVGLLQTDAAINPGNSGGPLLNSDGEIVGVADAIRTDAQGIGFAVPISRARGAIEAGTGLRPPVEPRCGRPHDDVTSGVRKTLRAYLGAINAGEYDKAMSLVSDTIRSGSSRSQWYSDYATTYDDRLRLRSVEAAAGEAQVWATFRSQQASGYGPTGAEDATCLLWSLDYAMVDSGGGWIIDGVSSHGASPWVRCD